MRRLRVFRGLHPDVVRCRARGHEWEPVSDPGVWSHRKVVFLTAERDFDQCDRCTTLREFVWSGETGVWLGTNYRYPPGYRLDEYTLPAGVSLKEAMRAELTTRERAGAMRRQLTYAAEQRELKWKKVKAKRAAKAKAKRRAA
jgi:hypothetical protein